MSLEEDVTAFVAEAAPGRTLAPTMTLRGDLGLDGDRARAFVEAFAERFEVQIGGFQFYRYFDEDGWDAARPWLVGAASLFNADFSARWRRARDAEREISIAHLIDVAEAKHWREPDAPRKALSALASALEILSGLVIVLGWLGLLIAAFAWYQGDDRRNALVGAAGFLGFILWMAWTSWAGIQRKLASA